MNKYLFITVCGAVGIVLGYISANTIFATSWTALILWDGAGLVLGYLSNKKYNVFVTGSIFGFLLTLSFLLFGFHGEANKFSGFVVFSLLLSLVGAICGLVLGLIGRFIHTKFQRINNK